MYYFQWFAEYEDETCSDFVWAKDAFDAKQHAEYLHPYAKCFVKEI
jgi:hypothetical protein